MLSEQHIEKLRDELRNAIYKDERKWQGACIRRTPTCQEEAAYDAMVLVEPLD